MLSTPHRNNVFYLRIHDRTRLDNDVIGDLRPLTGAVAIPHRHGEIHGVFDTAHDDLQRTQQVEVVGITTGPAMPPVLERRLFQIDPMLDTLHAETWRDLAMPKVFAQGLDMGEHGRITLRHTTNMAVNTVDFAYLNGALQMNVVDITMPCRDILPPRSYVALQAVDHPVTGQRHHAGDMALRIFVSSQMESGVLAPMHALPLCLPTHVFSPN